jgi:protein-S-isoprenylcysteine O-methyltransferase Ste14
MISQRRKGIQTDQIGKGKVGFVKFIEVTMKIITIIVPIAEIVSIILNTSVLPLWTRIVGICIAVTGVAVFITSVVTMRDSWRAGVSKTDKTDLVTSGIYSFSRNPAFLGFDLVYIGILLMFFNLILFIISVFGVVIFHLQIVNVEEDFLIDTFREEYINYKKKVCRYFGRR